MNDKIDKQIENCPKSNGEEDVGFKLQDKIPCSEIRKR